MNKKDITDKARDRENLIRDLDSSLDGLIKKYQAKLFSSVNSVLDQLVTDQEDKLVNNSANISVIGTLDKELNLADDSAKTAVINSLVTGFSKIVSFNGEYFQEMDAVNIKPVSNSVMDSLRNWLGIDKKNDLRKNGYLDTLVKSSVLKNEIKQRTVSAVVTGQGWKETKDNMGEFIQGNKDRLGAMQKYYRNFTYDTFAQVDRKASEDFGNSLGYNFAIYAGGLIETSRKWCIDHNGLVFHISEIRAFKPKEAIPPNYDPIADLGGYGCRHSLNWIPDSLAIRLRPDAVKFINDPSTGGVNPPAKKEEPVVAPKKEESPAPAPAKPAPVVSPPPAPTITQYSDTRNKYVGATHTDARKIISSIVPSARVISIGSKVPKQNIPSVISALDYLSKKYIIGSIDIPKIIFSGGSSYYGRVRRLAVGGDIVEVDLGNTTGEYLTRERSQILSQNLQRSKSAVDKQNSNIATLVHEWAHVLATERSSSLAMMMTGKNIDEFFSKLKTVRNSYVAEVNKLISSGQKDKAGAIYLGRYANTNINEFMAEGFTEYQLNSTPSKYAIKIGKLIDEYFKK